MRRGDRAFQIRQSAALHEKELTAVDHPSNGDEELFPIKITSYTKGLPHDNLGEVDPYAYRALIDAITSGDPAAFEAIPLGGTRRLANPQAALAFELHGPDSHALIVPPPPSFHSAEAAGEVAEVYWQALARDMFFGDYDSHPITAAAAADLSRFSDFRGPKIGIQVTPATLFRTDFPGVLAGPYLSQFLLLDAPFGALTINQRIRTVLPGRFPRPFLRVPRRTAPIPPVTPPWQALIFRKLVFPYLTKNGPQRGR